MWMLLWLACARQPAPDTTSTAEAAPKSAPVEVPPHGARVASARDAWIQGDLDGARSDAKAAAEALRAMAEPASRSVAALEAFASAADTASAAAALGPLASSCAGCHTGAPPPEEHVIGGVGDGVRAEMERHDGALRGAWTGLVTADAAAVTKHAAALSETVIAPVGGATPAVAALDDAVSAAAGRLASAGTDAERHAAFAGVVLACQTCHLARPEGIAIEPE